MDRLCVLLLIFGTASGNKQKIAAGSVTRLCAETEQIELTDVEQTFLLNLGDQQDVPEQFECILRVSTCASCLIEVTSSRINREKDECDPTGDVECFDLQFTELQAESTFGLPYREWSIFDGTTFTSSSNLLDVKISIRHKSEGFLNKLKGAFPVTLSSIDGNETLIGSSSEEQKVIQTPRYPLPYPKTLVKSYRLVNSDVKGFIRLIFDDYLINKESHLRIIDNKTIRFDSRIDHRRPAPIVSSGNVLVIEFRANGRTSQVGFRAHYQFVKSRRWDQKPTSIDCDKMAMNAGGLLNFDYLWSLEAMYIDCVWIVRKNPNPKVFDRVFVNIEEFDIGNGSSLSIHDGLTSSAPRVLQMTGLHPFGKIQNGSVTSTNSQAALYIRLQGGVVTSVRNIRVAYAHFYRWTSPECPADDEFHCWNDKCIRNSLKCDGVDHCGDGSDEDCSGAKSTHQTYHFDFERHDDHLGGFYMMIVISVGLIVLVLTIYFVHTRAKRRMRENREAARRVAENPDIAARIASIQVPRMHTVGERRFYVVPDRNVSVIEAPPCYDEALKHPVATSAYVNTAFAQSEAVDVPRSTPEPPPDFQEPSSSTGSSTEQSATSTQPPEDAAKPKDESWV